MIDKEMVLQLADSIVNYNASDEEKVVLSLSNLLRGYRDGCFYLTASAFFCSFFLAKLTDARLLKILNHIDQNRALLPSVSWRIFVVLDNPDYTKKEIKLFYFENIKNIAFPFFLSEHLNDICFYEYITRAFYPGATLNFIPAMGGGSSTSAVLRSLRRFGFVLTIVDSDRRYDKAKLGDTASRCNKEVSKNDTFVHLEVLNIHEVENLIPLLSLRRVKMNRESRALFNRIITKKYFSFLPFFDYKEGINVNDMEDALYRKFAEDLYGALYCSVDNKKSKEFTNHIKQCTKKGSKVFPGFRKDVLEEYLGLARRDNSGLYLSDVTSNDVFTNTRKTIADLVFSFCCARDSTPIN